MKELMKTNVYDVGESVLIVGSCLPDMEPEGFAQLCADSFPALPCADTLCPHMEDRTLIVIAFSHACPS